MSKRAWIVYLVGASTCMWILDQSLGLSAQAGIIIGILLGVIAGAWLVIFGRSG